MNKLICGILPITGCVLLADVSFADESYVRGYINEHGRYVLPDVRTPPPSSEVERRPVRRKVYPEPVKERTRDAMRAKRPK